MEVITMTERTKQRIIRECKELQFDEGQFFFDAYEVIPVTEVEDE